MSQGQTPPQAPQDPDNPGVPAVDRDGQLVTIPPDQAQAAFKAGVARPATNDELSAFQEKKQFGGTGQALLTGLESAGSAATLGASRLGEQALFGNQSEQQKRAQYNPIAKSVGTGVGLIAPLVATGGAAGPEEAASLGAGDLLNPTGAVIKAGGAIKDAVSPLAEKAAGMLANPETSPLINAALQKAISGGIGGAAEGSIFGAGNAVDEKALGDPNSFGELLWANSGYGALMGGGLSSLVSGAVAPISKSLAERGEMLESGRTDPGLFRNAVRKIISVAGGVNEEDQAAYEANPALVNSAPALEDVHQHASDFLGGLNDAVSNGKMSVEDAKTEYASFADDQKNALKQAGFDAKQANYEAKRALSNAQDEITSKIKSDAIEQGSAVADATQQLRQHVFDQSSAAYDVLDNSGKTVSLKPLYEHARSLVDELKERGTIESQSMAEKIAEQMRNISAQYGDEAPAVGAKKLIKGLDGISKYNFNASQFDNGLSNQYAQLRHTLDSTLKEAVPEYAEAMKPLAEDAKLLGGLKKYGTTEDATKSISGLSGGAKYLNEMPMLRQLEQRVGSNFTDTIEKYANQEVRKSLLESIPEHARAQKTADVVSHLSNPETKQALQDSLMKSKEYLRLQKSQAELEKALEDRGQFKGLTHTTLESKLKQVMVGKNIEALKVISKLPEMGGKSIPDIMKAIRLKQVFESGSINGSRHVNLYGAVLGGLSSLFGGNPFAGAGIGGAVGAGIDKYGPQLSKKVIDKLSGINPNISVLSKMESSANKTAKMSSRAAKAIFSGAPDAAAALVRLSPQTVAAQMAASRDIKTNPYAEIEQTNDAVKHIQPYAPSIATSMAATTARANNYLGSLVPQKQQFAIQPKESFGPGAMRSYQLARHTIDNPVSVLDSVKKGDLNNEQMKALVSVYPQLYNKFKADVLGELTNRVSKGEEIPYNTKISISKFLSQPIEAGFTPLAIQSNQIALAMPTAGAQSAQKKGMIKSPPKAASRSATGTESLDDDS